MYTSSYSSYGSGLGYPRYRDYSNSKFGDISVYSTPLNYSSSSLMRGSSLQDVSPSLGSSHRRLTRQSSLDKERPSVYQPMRNTTFTPGHYEQSYQDQIRSSRSATRHVKEEKKRRPINCNKVCPGIIIGNGETVCDISYLKSLGVTHVLNTAEQHVMVNPAKYAKHGIQYYGFHVDDLPHCDISRYFHRTTDFIHSAVNGGGLVVVNCYMGLSRSASCVLAYLMTKQDMSLSKALDYIKKSRGVRPNEGFLKQLKVLDRRPRY